MLEIMYVRDVKVKAEYGDDRPAYGIVWRDVTDMSKVKNKQYYIFFAMYNKDLGI